MIPSVAMQKQIATLVAGDTTMLASATPPKVRLAKQPFTPAPTLDPTTLIEADFGSYAAKSPTNGVQLSVVDPLSGLQTVELIEPAGGWHWAANNVNNLPQSTYGFYVTDAGGTNLLGSGLLPAAVPLTAAGQAFDVISIRLAFLNNSPQ